MKIKMTEAKLFSLIEEIVVEMLLEGAESNRISAAKKIAIQYGQTPEDAQETVDNVRNKIPCVRKYKCMFLPTLTKMWLDGELDDSNKDDLNKIVDYIVRHNKLDEKTFSNMSVNDLTDTYIDEVTREEYDQTEINKQTLSQKYPTNNQQNVQYNGYQIVQIPNFKEASKYSHYVSWCITKYDNYYNNYTNNGQGIFYFMLKEGFENIPAQQGEGYPLDEYGLSMVAVSVNISGELNTCTGRWNTGNQRDHCMNVEQISDLIGANFYSVFKNRDINEILQNMSFEEDGLAIQSHKGRYGLMDKNLRYVLSPRYDKISHAIYGIRELTLNKKIGIFKDLKVVLKPTYNDVHVMTYDGFVVVRGENYKYGLLDQNYQKILDADYKKIKPFEKGFQKVYIDDYTVGIVSKNGWVLDPKYKSIEKQFGINDNTYEIISKDDKVGILNQNAEIVLEVIYDKIRPGYYGNKFGCIFLNGKMGIISKDYELLSEIQYDNINMYRNDNTIEVKVGDKYGLLNSNFELILEPKFDSIHTEYETGVRIAYIDGKCGLLNKNMGWFIEPIYDEIYVGDDFPNKIVIKNDDKIGVMNYSKEWIIEPKYTLVEENMGIDNFILMKLISDDGKCGLTNDAIEWVLDPVYDKIEKSEQEGILNVTKNGKTKQVDINTFINQENTQQEKYSNENKIITDKVIIEKIINGIINDIIMISENKK